MRSMLWASLAALSFGALPAGAYVEAVYPLQQVIAESEVIAEGVVEKHDPGKKIAFIKIQKSLKGKCHYDVIRINYGGGQFYHPAVLPKHLVPGAPAIIFYNAGRQSQTYLNRFFFQIYGDAGAPPEKAWWNMTHIEIRMNRTFNGTVPQLSELLQKILSGRAKAPAPSPKVPPMDEATLKALPAHGEPVDEAKLPPPFRPFDPNAKSDASAKAVNGEGFISRWLVLGPIALGAAAADQNAAFNKDWVPNLKALQPKQHDKAVVGEMELRWEVADSADWFLDLGNPENSIHWCLSYVHADEDVAEAFLLTGSDDSAVWFLNGQEVQRVLQGRGVGKDQDRTAKPVSLKKGVNVLLTGVINGGGPTAACARFVDKSNQPLLKLRSGADPAK